ncbi:MAG TPA: sigma-70 family RNA polymerase sigma factor [Sedimentisphaerales bacterium]|nr:sigma-70 family RNA polymerase sigma factor [Sedimentisphaerales bacterium]
MFDRAIQNDLLWASAASEAVEESQRWILTAMQRYGPELVTLLWRILGSEQDVCDAYQTTFLRLAHLEDGRKPKWIKAYLFRTASNAAITMLRQRSMERKTLSNMTDAGEEGPTTEIDFDAGHLAESLRSHIAQLPEHLRSVIMLRDLGELSYAEVARIMGISTGTARVYRCKAVQMLAMWVTEEDNR